MDELESLFKILVPAISAIVGTIIGGVISYRATVAATREKWKQERAEKLAERKRRAIEAASSWLTPIDVAVAQAEGSTNLYRHGHIDAERLVQRWPNLLPALEDVPDHLRGFLPEDAYSRSLKVIGMLDELKVINLSLEEPKPADPQTEELMRERIRVLKELNECAASLRADLQAAYEATFAAG